MQRNIAMTIQYDGTRFDGWQRQGNTQNTIQGRLEALISRMTGTETELYGAGRTDAGVHAYAQVANFHTDCPMSCAEIMDYVNQYLPRDIAVTAVWAADSRFHARLNATGKHYRYRMRTSPVPDVFSEKYVWALGRALDSGAMAAAASALTGRHDFTSFCDNRRQKKSAVRTVYTAEITDLGEELQLDLTGSGFLYHMVRLIAGTLFEVGLGERAPETITEILDKRDRSDAGRLAPASGLCLMEVLYGG